MTAVLLAAMASSAFALHGFGTSPAVENERVEWEVRGTGFEKDPRLGDLERRAARAASESISRLEAELGLRPGKGAVRWILDTSPAPEGKAEGKAEGKSGPAPFEVGHTEFLGVPAGSIAVTLPARKYLRATARVEPVIRHEAVHALLASALRTRERYEAVPRWFREGLAVEWAGEGEVTLGEAIAYTAFHDRPADAFIVGIASPGVTYAEAFLGVQFLSERLDAPGMKTLVGRVADGKPLDAVLLQLLGQSMEAIAAGALRASRQRVARLCSVERERAFRESLREPRGAGPAAVRTWEALLQGDASGPLASTLHYLLGKHGIQGAPDAKAVRKARAHLEEVLSAGGCLWRPEALVLLGECHEAQGDGVAARDRWQEVLDVFGEDEGPALRARAHLGKSGVVK